jgi:hypothetical protein
MSAGMCFLSPECDATLRAGLDEYYASRSDLVSGRGLSPAASEFFRCHDTAHVIFGCSTSLVDEAVVKLWSFFGTTAGFSLLRDYRSPESQEIYTRIEWDPILSTALRSLVFTPLVITRALRMNKRWPWSEFEQHLDVSISALRREYGIRIVTPHPALATV